MSANVTFDNPMASNEMTKNKGKSKKKKSKKAQNDDAMIGKFVNPLPDFDEDEKGGDVGICLTHRVRGGEHQVPRPPPPRRRRQGQGAKAQSLFLAGHAPERLRLVGEWGDR